MNEQNEKLKALPKVDELLRLPALHALENEIPRAVILESVREAIHDLRVRILDVPSYQLPAFPKEYLLTEILKKLKTKTRPHLIPVVNATGVVLHTNLGRARLSRRTCEHVLDTALHYSNLEYNLAEGLRGSRYEHVEHLICRITGAEAAMVVNNNAAATILCLSTVARGKEVLVSRGELVEIGGAFRITEIMEQSGAILRETGSTNKTRLLDYRRLLDRENTAALMKVHTSNFRVVGFTEETSLLELSGLAGEFSIPLIYDMGNGLMVNLKPYGIDEPTVTDALKSGADILLFSGDKLLGGPQGGIIAGKKVWIDQMKTHPLARAFRVDKMTLAAMESTFYEYLDEKTALERIPTLQMLTLSPEALRGKAEYLKEQIEQNTSCFTAEITPCEEQVGGGAAPLTRLKGCCVALTSPFFSAKALEEGLRSCETPIIARIMHETVCLDMRTVLDEETDIILHALSELERKGI